MRKNDSIQFRFCICFIELPVASPLVHAILRSLAKWQEILSEDIENKGPAPQDFIPGIFVETEATGPAIHKYRTLLERQNTPFKGIYYFFLQLCSNMLI